MRENIAVFTAERQDTSSNITAAARHVNTELIIMPGVPASIHLPSSADARDEHSDMAVSQMPRDDNYGIGVTSPGSCMNPVIRRQTCLCAAPQGLTDMEASSQLKQNRQINRDGRNFLKVY